MGTMPIPKLLLTMSGPMMISMFIQALYNVVDSMFVSYISEAALTAVSLAYPMQNLMIAVATGTGVGVNALLSRNLGEKNYSMANRVAGNAIFLGLVSYVVFALLGLLGSRFYFSVQVEDPNIIALGHDYLSIVTVLSIGCFGQVLLSRLLQSTGKTFYSMVIQMVGAGLNLVLDPIMIFGLLGFPKMGVAGAALATVISQLAGTALGIYYNLRKNQEIQFSLSTLRPSKPVISRIYGVGIPSILLQTVSSVLIFGLNQILVAFSETATAVYGVFFKLQGFAFLPIIGMNNGMVRQKASPDHSNDSFGGDFCPVHYGRCHCHLSDLSCAAAWHLPSVARYAGHWCARSAHLEHQLFYRRLYHCGLFCVPGVGQGTAEHDHCYLPPIGSRAAAGLSVFPVRKAGPGVVCFPGGRGFSRGFGGIFPVESLPKGHPSVGGTGLSVLIKETKFGCTREK